MGPGFFVVELVAYLLTEETVEEIYHFRRLNHSEQEFQSSYYPPKAILMAHILMGHMTCLYIVALSHLFKTCFLNLTQKKVHWSSTLFLRWRGNYSMLMSSNFYSVCAGSGNFFFTRKDCCSRNQPLNKSMLQIVQIPKNLKLD